MNIRRFIAIIAACSLTGLGGCSRDEAPGTEIVRFDISYPAASRVSDGAFEEGDQVGIFMKETERPLEVSGNPLNNEPLTCNEGEWTPRRTLHWDEGVYDVVGYYPYRERVESVTDLPFSVALDQSTEGDDGTPGGYEASDFLWAERNGVTAGDGTVHLIFAHRMSRVVVRLVKDDEYEGDIPDDAVVRIHGTTPAATIDLEAGVVTKDPRGTEGIITARRLSPGLYAAIVVPQRLEYNRPLVEVIADGVSYLYSMRFVFRSGMEHTLTVVLTKNPEQSKIEIGGEIEGWSE